MIVFPISLGAGEWLHSPLITSEGIALIWPIAWVGVVCTGWKVIVFVLEPGCLVLAAGEVCSKQK